MGGGVIGCGALCGAVRYAVRCGMRCGMRYNMRYVATETGVCQRVLELRIADLCIQALSNTLGIEPSTELQSPRSHPCQPVRGTCLLALRRPATDNISQLLTRTVHSHASNITQTK